MLLWALLALAAMGCLAAAGVSYWWSQRGPDHPDTWDPRVRDLAAFVEQERGVSFEHPVTVNFLDPEQYAEITSAPEGGPDDEAVAAADDQVAMFRALGLMTGEVDLLDSNQDLFGSSTAAFYDSISEQVYVNATAEDELSTSTAATVVHELTHVLQDQVDGLDDAFVDDDDPTTDRTDAHLAIVEGDAMVVESAYLASLSDDEIDSYLDEWESLVEESEAAVDEAGVPPALDLLFGVPYALGPSFVTVADAVGDRDVVDAAIGGDVPPSVAVLDLETDDWPDEDPPEVPSHDGEELDVDTFGAMTWLVVLGGASTPDQALTAASTWSADRVVQYRDHRDRLCVAATVVVARPDDGGSGDDPVDATSTFAAAAARWAASLPLEAGATAVEDGDEVELRSCDPGPDVEVAAAGSEGAPRLLSGTGSDQRHLRDVVLALDCERLPALLFRHYRRVT